MIVPFPQSRSGPGDALSARCYLWVVLFHALPQREVGRPLVLLHGFLGSHRNLGVLARGLSKARPDRKIYSVDLLGHGRSPRLPDDADLATMAQALLDWMFDLRLPHGVDIVGHSLGGRVALQCRLMDPNQVGQVILLDIQPGPIAKSDTETVVKALLRAPERTPDRESMHAVLLAEGLSEGLIQWLLMSAEKSDEGFAWRINRRALADFHVTMRAVDLWPAVTPSPATVCIRGADSSYVAPEEIIRLERDGVAVTTIEDAGHFLHVDKSKAVIEAVAAALL